MSLRSLQPGAVPLPVDAVLSALKAAGEATRLRILAEAEACHRAHPGDHVRLIGFDNHVQSRGAEMVIFRGDPV